MVNTVSRVANDLENLVKSGNLKETSASQGIFLNIQRIYDRTIKVREFCCLKFFSAKLKILVLKMAWGACPQPPLNGLGLMIELTFDLKKSGDFI